MRILLAAMVMMIPALAQPHTRAELLPEAQRKPAPAFWLKDSRGKTIELKNYRGKVLLLDFWATWCHGCKEEIPWFADFQKNYGRTKLAVIGVSMDEDGWKVLGPFLKANPIPYTTVLGDAAITKAYDMRTLPRTYLIDRQGRIAAAYTSGLVDRENVEANLRSMLGER